MTLRKGKLRERVVVREELTARERQVLEAVVRTYVDTAAPVASLSVSRRWELGVSAATIRNTMAELESKGYLARSHASAGRVPTDTAYRYFVDRLIRPAPLTSEERDRIEEELDPDAASPLERLVRRTTRALSLISHELGLGMVPSLDSAVLEKIELIRLSAHKALMVATVRKGLVRTLYVDLPLEIPRDTLVILTVILNERLAGRTFADLRESLPERLRDPGTDSEAAAELLNIFMESAQSLLDWPEAGRSPVLFGQASMLASQPEFTSGQRLKSLIELTERNQPMKSVLSNRRHGGGLRITIGQEHRDEALSGFTLVTAEYRVGGLKGVVGVIGPTRMPYERVISLVDYTSSLVNDILR